MLPTKSRRKRTQVKRACTNCRKAHSACGHERPCPRCVSRDEGHMCVDIPLKRRKIASSDPSHSTSLREKSNPTTKKRALSKATNPRSPPSRSSFSEGEDDLLCDNFKRLKETEVTAHSVYMDNCLVERQQEEEEEEEFQQQQQHNNNNNYKVVPISTATTNKRANNSLLHLHSQRFKRQQLKRQRPTLSPPLSTTTDDEEEDPCQKNPTEEELDTEEEPKFYFADDLGCQSSPSDPSSLCSSSFPTSPNTCFTNDTQPYCVFTSSNPSATVDPFSVSYCPPSDLYDLPFDDVLSAFTSNTAVGLSQLPLSTSPYTSDLGMTFTGSCAFGEDWLTGGGFGGVSSSATTTKFGSLDDNLWNNWAGCVQL